MPEAARALLVTDAERSAREAASILIGQTARGVLPSTLIEELLLVEQKDFLFVDTVDRAGRWDILIHDALPLRDFELQRLEAFCSNLWAWESSVAFEDRNTSHDVKLLSLGDGDRVSTAMMEFECALENSKETETGLPIVEHPRLGHVLAWKALPGNTPLNELSSEEVPDGTGATWDKRFPAFQNKRDVNYSQIRNVTGTCKDGLVWTGGWDGKDGSDDHADFLRSYAGVSTCERFFGPLWVSCSPGDDFFELRLAYDSNQLPNKDGFVALEIDGDVTILFGENGDVHGHEQVFAKVPRNHPVFEKLKRGNLLRLIGDGPQQVIHLSGSRAAIEAMELSCP